MYFSAHIIPVKSNIQAAVIYSFVRAKFVYLLYNFITYIHTARLQADEYGITHFIIAFYQLLGKAIDDELQLGGCEEDVHASEFQIKKRN